LEAVDRHLPWVVRSQSGPDGGHEQEHAHQHEPDAGREVPGEAAEDGLADRVGGRVCQIDCLVERGEGAVLLRVGPPLRPPEPRQGHRYPAFPTRIRGSSQA
jgi:hypothetical protein